MSELSEEKRAKLPGDKFGLPERARSKDAKKETGNYPMPDKPHAANAKARSTQQYEAGNLTKSQMERIHRKAAKILDSEE